MEQLTIFDAMAAQRLAEQGLARAGRDKNVLLARAKQVAVTLAKRHPERTVTMDDVCAELFAEGIDSSALGNAAGSTFRGKGWRHTGRVVRSKRPLSHARTIGVWEWIGEI
jgi:hypothetical protein